MNEIVELTGQSFQTEVLQASGTVLVDFYAPWCGPCKMLAPVLAKLAGQFSGRVRIAKLNVDEAAEIAGSYQITGVPTLMLFREGEIVGRVVGLATPKQLEAWLEKETATSAAAI